ncbi:MAG: ABC transporter permease [Bacteroidaceae bacterium]|nr:ABC transporter permease [Bacteroidaceae bacterium]
MKSKIGIIIGREFNERVQKKSFIFTTLLTPLLMLLLIFAPMLISGYSDDTTKTVAVVDESGIIAQQLTSSNEIQFEHTPLPLEIARNEYSNCYAILHIGRDIINNPSDAYLYTNGTAAMGTEHNISAQLTMAVQKEKMKLYNVEQQVIQELNTHVMPQSLKNSPSSDDAESSSAIVASVLAYILSFILYMFLLLYGVMVMQSVIEEKNNRVLEVLVSTVRPFDMMMGKILGIASVALLQIIIWILFIAGIAYFVLPHILPEEILTAMEMLKQGVPAAALDGGAEMGMLQAIMMLGNIKYVGGIIVWLLVFVFGGFLLYAAMFAAVGSAVDSPQDAQQLQTPIMLPIMLALFVMLSVINDPTSDVAFWFSIIPFTSPIVMMARIPYEIPTWEICVSALLLYATFFIVVWGAGKIYRVGILMHGKKPNLKELLRWIRYK